MAGLHGPRPTLRPWPRGQTRTARGRRGSLLLRRIGLSPTTPGRSPGALPVLKDQARRAVVAALPVGGLIALFGLSLQAFGASLDGAAVGRLQAFAPPVLVRLLY